MKKLYLILPIVLMAAGCMGAGLTTSSLNGVATNLTMWNSVTNKAIPQPSPGATNVVAIGSDGKEIAIPFLNFGGGTILPTGVLTNFDTRAWTNLNAGVSRFAGMLQVGRINADGGGVLSSGSGSLQVGALVDLGALSAGSGTFTVDVLGNVVGLTFSGDGHLLNSLNASSLATGTVPIARLGSGTANGLTFLRGDSSWFGVVTNLEYTNSGPDVLLINDIAVINTNGFGGGAGGITTLTGDVAAGPGSGSVVATVLGANGTLYSTLASGVLLNTTGTGVPSVVTTWPNLGSHLSGIIPTGALGTGSATSGTFLRGDQTWATATGASGITALTQDVTATGPGSAAATVVGINGTLLSGLANGFLYLTAGVPSTKATWPNLAAVLTGLIPQSALGTGSGGTGTKFLADDQTYKTISGGGGFTNVLSSAAIRGYFLLQTNITATGDADGSSMAVGDMNTDGIPDIVISGNHQFNVFTNAGGLNAPGTEFALAFSKTGLNDATGISLADVNGDGRLDVIDCDVGAGTITVYTNSGNGTLVQLGSAYTFATPTFTVVGDYNNDGHPDFLAESSVNSIQPTIYTNNGVGIFAVSTNFPATLAGTWPKGAAAADMNSDGFVDLIFCVAGVNAVDVLTNNGLGVFAQWTTNRYTSAFGVIPANVNGDAQKDLIVYNTTTPSSVVVLTNNGTGFGVYSSNTVFGSTPNTVDMAVGDWNADGLIDVALSSHGLNTYVSMTNSGAGFVSYLTNTIPLTPDAIASADFNLDGFSDLATFSPQATPIVAQVWLNNVLFNGLFRGDARGITNGQISVVYQTAATSWTPSSSPTNFGTLNVGTNFLPRVAAFERITQVGDGATLTNIPASAITNTSQYILTPILPGEGAQNAGALPAANTVYGIMMTVNTTVGITNITFRVGTGVAGALASFAIWNLPGTTKLYDSGAVNIGTGSGNFKTAIASPGFLFPGNYLFCFTADNVITLTFNSANFNAADTPIINGGTFPVLFSTANASSSGAMPATLGALTAFTSGINVPIVYWGN